MKLSRLLPSTLLLVCFAPLQSNATTVLYKNLHDLIDEADNIVVGMVEKISTTRAHQDQDTYTHVHLSDAYTVESSGRARVNGTVVLRLLGGSVDIEGENGEVVGQEVLEVVGAPSFRVGERAVLFVRGNGKDEVPLVGWGQGVLRVSEGDQIEDVSGNTIIGLDGTDFVTQSEDGLITTAAPSVHGKRSDLSATPPELVSSDGGADALVDAERPEGQQATPSYMPIDLRDIESIAAERKLSRHIPYSNHLSLTTLPAVSRTHLMPDSDPSDHSAIRTAPGLDHAPGQHDEASETVE